MFLPLAAGIPLIAKIFAGTAVAGAGVGLVRALTGSELEKPEEDAPAFDKDRSAFGEVMDWLQLAGQPVQNMFAGRFGSAGRTALDTVTRVFDAVLPGDFIPDVSKKSDITSPTELVSDALGVNPDNVPWWVRIPTDIAGDIVTNPTNLLSFGTGAAKSVSTLGKQLDNIAAVGVKAADVGADAARTGIPGLVQNADQHVTSAIEAGITRTGRKALAKEGITPRAFADTVFQEAGGEAQVAASLIADGGKYAGMFQQGGLRFAGKQVPVAPMLDFALGKLGQVSPSMEAAIRKGGDVAMQAAKNVGRAGAAVSGIKFGVHPQISKAMKDAKQIGSLHAATAARFMEDTLTKLPKDAHQDVMDVFFNITKDGDTYKTLSPGTVPSAPFMTKADQLSLLHNRIDDAVMSGKKFGGLSVDEVKAASENILDQQMSLFDIDATMGFMGRPSMYAHPVRGLVTKGDLLAEHADELKALDAGLRDNISKLDDMKRLVDDALGTPQKPLSKDQVDLVRSRIADLTDEIESSAPFQKWLAGNGFASQQIDTKAMSPPLYMHRMWTQGDDAAEFMNGTMSNFTKARTLRDQDDFVQFLNAGGNLNKNAADVILSRINKSGRDVSYASMMRQVIGDVPENRSLQAAFREAMDSLAKDAPELKSVLNAMAKPIPPRGTVFKALNKVNTFWKGPVLFGFLLPRFMAPTRNRVWANIQEAGESAARFSNPLMMASDLKQTWALAGREYAKALKKMRGSMADDIVDATGMSMPRDGIQRALTILDEAQARSRGDYRRLGEAIRSITKPDEKQYSKWLEEAAQHGVLDGFVSTEELVKKISRDPKKQGWKDLFDVPAKVFQDVEHRMRIGQYLDLRRQGVSASEAARVTNSVYLDYEIAGVADRAMRDVIPFAAFLTRTIPQQFQVLSRYGTYRGAIASIYGSNRADVNVPPWIEDQAYIDLGMTDKQGNPIVAAGFGTPIEALNLLPASASLAEIGRTIRRSLVAQTNPAIKELYSRTAGRDPFFNTKVGSYDKTPAFLRPMFGERSEVGSFIQDLRRVGLTAHAESFLGQSEIVAKGAESAKRGDMVGVGSAMLRMFSGARLQPVDESQAVVQQLQQRIELDPRIKSGKFIYTRSEDPGTRQLVAAFKRAKADVKRKRQEQAE
jgi:hypothetical protein